MVNTYCMVVIVSVGLGSGDHGDKGPQEEKRCAHCRHSAGLASIKDLISGSNNRALPCKCSALRMAPERAHHNWRPLAAASRVDQRREENATDTLRIGSVQSTARVETKLGPRTRAL